MPAPTHSSGRRPGREQVWTAGPALWATRVGRTTTFLRWPRSHPSLRSLTLRGHHLSIHTESCVGQRCRQTPEQHVGPRQGCRGAMEDDARSLPRATCQRPSRSPQVCTRCAEVTSVLNPSPATRAVPLGQVAHLSEPQCLHPRNGGDRSWVSWHVSVTHGKRGLPDRRLWMRALAVDENPRIHNTRA